jgi:choline dehydrogenase-like flavoprotein
MRYLTKKRLTHFARTQHGCEGWSAADVAPHYERVERSLSRGAVCGGDDLTVSGIIAQYSTAGGGAAGSLGAHVNRPELPEAAAFLDSAVCTGLPMNLNYNASGEQQGVAVTQSSVDVSRARRLDAFTTIIEPILLQRANQSSKSSNTGSFAKTSSATPRFMSGGERPELTVCSGAFVRRLILDEGKVARGVELELADGEKCTVLARYEVVKLLIRLQSCHPSRRCSSRKVAGAALCAGESRIGKIIERLTVSRTYWVPRY